MKTPTSSISKGFCQTTPTAPVGACYEIEFPVKSNGNPPSPLSGTVVFQLPNNQQIQVHGFATANHTVKARAYIGQPGLWKWTAYKDDTSHQTSGSFQAITSSIPGKLKLSPSCPFSFEFSNGSPFCHFGDNALRLLISSESCWQAYLEQANQAGFNKIRSYLSDSNAPSEGILTQGKESLKLEYWDEIDKRLLYALDHYPKMQIEIIPFAEHSLLLADYLNGALGVHNALRYAQERFSALPNIHWGAGDGDNNEVIAQIGESLQQNEQWDSLITNLSHNPDPHSWQSYTSLKTKGEISGNLILKSKALKRIPVTIARDVSEYERLLANPRYYYRRQMWSCLLSGGSTCYQGLDTKSPFENNNKGIQGYYNACHSERLQHGAHDILNIKKFLFDLELDLRNWKPNDSISGNTPFLSKSMQSPDGLQCIVYLSNPDRIPVLKNNQPIQLDSVLKATPNPSLTTINLKLPFQQGQVHWFAPNEGTWHGGTETSQSTTILLTPEPGDWVIFAHDARCIHNPLQKASSQTD